MATCHHSGIVSFVSTACLLMGLLLAVGLAYALCGGGLEPANIIATILIGAGYFICRGALKESVKDGMSLLCGFTILKNLLLLAAFLVPALGCAAAPAFLLAGLLLPFCNTDPFSAGVLFTGVGGLVLILNILLDVILAVSAAVYLSRNSEE